MKVVEAFLVVATVLGIYRMMAVAVHLIDRVVTTVAERWLHRNRGYEVRLERIAWELEKLQ